jgi:hypothetical protein
MTCGLSGVVPSASPRSASCFKSSKVLPKRATIESDSVARSFISVVSATPHPPPCGPSRFSRGTRTSSKKSWLNSSSPVIWRSGRTLTPGLCMSTRR